MAAALARVLAALSAAPALTLVAAPDGASSSNLRADAGRLALARKVEEMYGHGFESYMAYAFPADELRPLSCDGRTQRERGDLDAVLGNYSLTLIDSLDSLVIFRRYEDFERAVSHIIEEVDFDKDIEVSTFEINIRVLGGLLSGHLLATKFLEGYSGGLLDKALDLTQRIRPAFDTPTGMPVTRINLRFGKPGAPSNTVTTAEAGSFIIEFGVVTLLTGDATFYHVAKRALWALWQKRSSLNLVGTTVDVNTGAFQDHQSTTGPGQDSFYEYLLKGYILFDDLELLDMFQSAYSAVEQHHGFEGFTYNVDMFRGIMSNPHLSPLSCVWASLQVLMGDVAAALRSVLYWYGIWKKSGALPEVFDTKTEEPTNQRDSPLRPELIEAVFYLSLALPGDAEIQAMVTSFADAIDSQSRVPCGFAAVADVTTKRLDDRMDSYFLSETLVYLYLASSPAAELEKILPWSMASTVFSTEGHMFPLPQTGPYQITKIPGLELRVGTLYPGAARRPILTCEALTPFERAAMQHRCRTTYVLTQGYQTQANGCVPNRCRVQQVTLLVDSGAEAPLRLEGMAASFGPPPQSLPQCRRCNTADPGERQASPSCREEQRAHHSARPPPHELGLGSLALDRPPGRMASFAAVGMRGDRFWELFSGRRLVAAKPFDACSELLQPEGATGSDINPYEGKVVLVSRGSCLFLQKIHFLQGAGAVAAIVMNQANHKELQVMTCPLQDRGAGHDVHIQSVMLGYEDGTAILNLLRRKGSKPLTASIYSPD